MSHPSENETDWAKLEMIANQYQIKVVPITKRMYQRIKERFKDKIEQSGAFNGWETYQDNLRTNPAKYGLAEKATS